MLNQENILVIAGVCGIVLFIGAARKYAGQFLSVILRMVIGTAGIYLLELVLPFWSIGLTVGVNLFNMLVVGVLGLPGFGLLYAISAVKLL